MKIGVISDTHDRLTTFRWAVHYFRSRNVAAIIHAGDFIAPFSAKLVSEGALGELPFYGVLGNNDGERAGLKQVLPGLEAGPLHLRLGLPGAEVPVLVHHFLDWVEEKERVQARIIITGHTHQVDVAVRGEQLFLNPGECCGWVTGRCTAALLDLSQPLEDAVKIIEIPEAGLR